MLPCDVMIMPTCDVAEDATWCWHDVIKNRIQAFDDTCLALWLQRGAEVETFERRLRGVCEGVSRFSPSKMLESLEPFRTLPAAARHRVAAFLDASFARGFRPDEVASGLRPLVDQLLASLRRCRAAQSSSDRSQLLSECRRAATAVRAELEALPEGYWVPRPGRVNHRDGRA